MQTALLWIGRLAGLLGALLVIASVLRRSSGAFYIGASRRNCGDGSRLSCLSNRPGGIPAQIATPPDGGLREVGEYLATSIWLRRRRIP